MIAICSYSLDKCGASEVIDVVSNHPLVLTKNEKNWELVESSVSKQKENELSETNVRLKILQQVTEAVHGSLELKRVFEQVTDGFVNSMGYTTAFIATLNDEKKRLEVKTFSTKKQLLPKINKILGYSLKDFSFRVDTELNAAISSAMNGKVVITKTLAEIGYPLISKRKCTVLQKLGGTKNCIIMPLRDEKEVVGGVVITSSQEEVSNEELGMIKSFAHAASQAIKNANLHQKTKQAEEALRKSEEKYKFLVDNSKEIILILSKTGKILFANKSALGNFGYSKEELLGKSITHFLAKGSIRKALYALAQELLRRPQPVMEIQAKTKSGKIRYLEVAEGSTPIYDKKKLVGVMISASDITERKKAEEKIKASLQEKEVLLQEIHHRVKNNMQIISSLVKLQSRHVTDNDALETFRSTQNRVKSMALIHERLYQSKDFAKVDFEEYVRSLASNLFAAYTVAPGNIELHANIKDVFVDINTAIPCGLIINELISNSLKHAFPNGKKGQIDIIMHPLNKNEAELTFSDNGVGLPEDVDFRNTESLGLHLVTILAEDQLHGNIKLDRKEGTKFNMRLRIRK
jgi:PAS domain S-box-containing protein